MNDEVSTLGESYDQIRRAVLDLLTEHCNRRGQREQLSVERDVERVLAELGLTGPPKDRTRVLAYQIYHELHLERLIFPGIPVEMGSHNMQWPFYQITGHGRQVLQNREYSPYDPDGYLRRLKEDIPGVDETIIRYVEESLNCLRTFRKHYVILWKPSCMGYLK